ncbi:MAG: MBOAT family protein, partial [Bacteroidales bacterium]|nr:MBOAT family protein [Bacteroidales bacterium]
MEIVSLLFAVLVIVSIFIYYALNPRYRVLFLTILSCGFIASYHVNLFIYVIIYTSINFYLGLKIPDSKFRLTLYRLGLAFNLSQLILLKYASFAIDPAFQLFNLDVQVQNLAKIILPFGISYFTLQGIGYLINVKMGWEKPERNFVNFLLYIIFYPKFLSGPIERSNHFLPQLSSLDTMNTHKITEGLKIALVGFFQKTVIANQLGPLINNTYSDLSLYSGFDLWAVLLIQPFYLYFDFAGYTNIAIGFAKIYGIELLPNFNRPFLSENVTTFWKRFHMSLSLWFHDYVFRQFSFKYRKLGINAA